MFFLIGYFIAILRFQSVKILNLNILNKDDVKLFQKVEFLPNIDTEVATVHLRVNLPPPPQPGVNALR